MASISTIATGFFSLQAISRPKTRNPNPNKSSRQKNPNTNRNSKPQKSKFKSTPQPISVTGGEATTYTRLPPREDFTAPSLNFQTPKPTEVKLSDSNVVKIDKESQTHRFSNGNGMDSNFGESYGRLDGSSNFEEVEEEDDGYDDDYDSEEEEIVDGKIVNNYNSDGYYEGEMEAEEEGDVKEKGVPAVMRCFDLAKIYVKAGDGGNGVVAFRREKFVPMGGPSGGDGGRGGNVYVEVDGSMNSLLPFRNKVHFRAGRGAHGQGQMMDGAKGEDVVVKVPPGTVVRDAGSEAVLLELLFPGQRALILPGGRGGRGNAAFKCGSNKVPRIAENGEEGTDM